MSKYGVIRTDKLEGSFNAAALVSLKYLPSATATAIDNGNVVVIGGLVSGEREVFIATTPARNSALSVIAIVATPELMVDERKKNLNEFRNEAGDICRGYMLRSGDIFSVTADAITNNTSTTIAAGHVVELVAGIKLSIVTSLTGGSTKVGDVIAVEGDYIVIKVV